MSTLLNDLQCTYLFVLFNKTGSTWSKNNFFINNFLQSEYSALHIVIFTCGPDQVEKFNDHMTQLSLWWFEKCIKIQTATLFRKMQFGWIQRTFFFTIYELYFLSLRTFYIQMRKKLSTICFNIMVVVKSKLNRSSRKKNNKKKIYMHYGLWYIYFIYILI